MKSIYLITLLILVHFISFGQSNDKLGNDCNPKLNQAEIQFIKNTLGSERLNLADKNVGFSTNDGFKIWGFGNSFMAISKKKYFRILQNDTNNDFTIKLLELDNIQKQTTKGFDAILFVYRKKYIKKANKCKFERIITSFGYRDLNYPDNLKLVGNDNSKLLSNQDAEFFNRIYKFQRDTFDFTNKKVAYINTNDADQIKSKNGYIRKIKKHLEDDFLYPTDYLFVFNDNEKKETGGYDAVIVYQCLKCGKQDAIRLLK